jgi:hypothetical protein
MPHLVLAGELDWSAAAAGFGSRLERWGRAVLKTEELWVRQDRAGLLVAGVVVEFSRPLHPVAAVLPRGDDTVVRLWSRAPVERTRAVQRWLANVAAEVQRCGGGGLLTTNIPADLLEGLDLRSV